MRFFDFLKAVISIHKLSKINDVWGKVYKSYLICMSLIVLISLLRYITDLLLFLIVLLAALHVLYNPAVMSVLMASSFYRWISTMLPFPNFHERSYFT